ncbi:MAG: hypothetical protein ACFFCW_00135 [Candidatus Hodarchaeota archaeon]
MFKPTYKFTIGSATFDSTQDPNTQIISIELQISMAPVMDFAKIVVGSINKPEGGLVGQAIAAGGTSGASGEINGTTVNVGDNLTIELGHENNLTQVFAGILSEIEPSVNTVVFMGSNGADNMTKTRINQTYQNQSAGQIVSDLAGQVNAEIDVAENGIDFPFYIVDDRKHVFQHAVELAAKSGLDLYVTPENQFTMRKFQKTRADHTFSYGEDIIEVQIFQGSPVAGNILVSGESPASSQGNDAWHWFAKDSSAFQGSAGEGNALLIQESSIRTKEGADTYAAGKLDLVTRAATHGRIVIVGKPEVRLGDAIAIEGVPTESLNGLFQVRRVRHQLSKIRGFTTTIDFIAAEGGGGTLGGLM